MKLLWHHLCGWSSGVVQHSEYSSKSTPELTGNPTGYTSPFLIFIKVDEEAETVIEIPKKIKSSLYSTQMHSQILPFLFLSLVLFTRLKTTISPHTSSICFLIRETTNLPLLGMLTELCISLGLTLQPTRIFVLEDTMISATLWIWIGTSQAPTNRTRSGILDRVWNL